jgi:spore germination protein YaaH
MYTDINKMYAAFREGAVTSRFLQVVRDDLKEGVAIEVPAGTRVYDVEKIDRLLSRVRIGSVRLFTVTSRISCR